MKRISAIIGHRVPCSHCGASVQLVIVPALSDRWQVCEPAESDVVQLHDCPRWPSKLARIAAAEA